MTSAQLTVYFHMRHNPQARHAARRRCLLSVAVVFCTLWVLLSSHEPRAQSSDLKGQIESQKERLKKIQDDINRHRSKTSELKRQEGDVAKQLGSLDKEIQLSEKLLTELATREKLLGQEIDSLRVSIAYETQMLAYQRRKLAARLRQMYMRGPNYDMQIMLASPSVMDASRRYKFLQMVAQRDARLVDEVRTSKAQLESERAELTEAMADVVTLRKAQVDESESLKDNRATRLDMLGRIRNEKSQHVKAIEALQKSEEELKDLIGLLEQRRLSKDDGDLPAGDFAQLKGRLIRPVSGKVTKTFGKNRHPQFGTVTFNNGVNIKAPAGAPIRAVATGKVEFVDWISGYGNCIILNHGGGYYTLYAHAAQILVAPGRIVSQNDVIAEVGDSGSLDGYECHFEIRKSKEALDPMKWFKK